MVNDNKNTKEEPSYIKRLNLKPDLSKSKYDARTQKAVEKYRKLYPEKDAQTPENRMQQPKRFYIDDPHTHESHYVCISEVESISHIGWKNNNPDSVKVIIRTKSSSEFVLRQEWGEKGQLLGDVYDTFVDYVKRLEIKE